MFCPNCGTKLNENGKCDNCSKSSSDKMINVVINRVSSFIGCAVTYKAYVDGNEIGKLANGGSVTISLPAGNHSFAFDMWSASNAHEIMIPDNCSSFIIDTKIQMGLLTNKIIIVSTRSE